MVGHHGAGNWSSYEPAGIAIPLPPISLATFDHRLTYSRRHPSAQTWSALLIYDALVIIRAFIQTVSHFYDGFFRSTWNEILLDEDKVIPYK